MARVSVDLFAAVAVRRGFLSRRRLEAALREIGLENARDRQRVIATFVRRGDLTTADVEKILKILRGGNLWCGKCRELHVIEHYDPQEEYSCVNCATPLRRVDGLDRASHLKIEDVFEEIEPESKTIRLSRWKVIKRLGTGGMGRVYLARHRKLQNLVAIKVLPPDLASDGDYVKLFVKEGRALAKLQHPNIVEVYDIDEEQGAHFLVMEYVDGVSLRDLVDHSGTVSPKAAIRIAMEVCRALEHAHGLGFIHRDIKPGNILLGRHGEIKLTDFGLVREVSPDSFSLTEALLGTPYYMAPEQAKGKAADARADLYSLGATLHAILAGMPPHQGADTIEILLKVVNDDPKPLQAINPAVPASLSDVVLRLMSKVPAGRYPSAAAVLRDLARCFPAESGAAGLKRA